MRYNGPAAAVAGIVAGLVMFILHSMALLPGTLHHPEGAMKRDLEATFVSGPWSLVVGSTVSICVFLLWRSKRSIFLDCICIHQRNASKKAQALLSLGAFLKNSSNFLLLWDDTYTSRLWCVFELAAFLKSHGQHEETLLVRPMVMAPCLFGIFFGLWLSVLVWVLVMSLTGSFWNLTLPVPLMVFIIRMIFFSLAAASLRDHYRNVEVLLGQLSSFEVASAKCHCCTIGTCASNKMLCDREIISRCIRNWFGSVSDFQEVTRSSVRSILHRQLGGKLFPYRWVLASSLPLLWGFMDMISPRLRAGAWLEALNLTLIGFGWWLFAFPAFFALSLILARRMRTRFQPRCLDHMATLMVSTCITSLTLGGNFFHLGLTSWLPHPAGGSIYFCSMAMLWIWAWFFAAPGPLPAA
eukprot:Skav231758  [mRNA]  locus=scaffold695:102828:104060:- [translate_table: standard]